MVQVNYAKQYIETNPDTETTAHTVEDLPEGLWPIFKLRIKRNPYYTRRDQRIVDLIALDHAIETTDDEGRDVFEYAQETGLATWDDINTSRGRPLPDDEEIRKRLREKTAKTVTIRDLPKGVWIHFRARADGDLRYTRVGDRVLDLLALDQYLADEYNTGLLEYCQQEGVVDSEAMYAALDTPDPR